MMGLLGLPPLLMLAIIVAVLAYLVYHIAANGGAQPLTIIALSLLVLPSFESSCACDANHRKARATNSAALTRRFSR
jgi:hypothetical protein